MINISFVSSLFPKFLGLPKLQDMVSVLSELTYCLVWLKGRNATYRTPYEDGLTCHKAVLKTRGIKAETVNEDRFQKRRS